MKSSQPKYPSYLINNKFCETLPDDLSYNVNYNVVSLCRVYKQCNPYFSRSINKDRICIRFNSSIIGCLESNKNKTEVKFINRSLLTIPGILLKK